MDPWEPPAEVDEYRLVERLGAGGMGVVYLAHDRLLDRAVAIKFLRAQLDEPARRRFVIEARAAARIHHPNVMGVHRVGELDDHPYIVTEYVRGTSLAELSFPLPWTRALELGIGLARGLATVHRHGVLHRDIKLANAILDAETGEVKLLDFSLAKVERIDVLLDDDGVVHERPPELTQPLAGVPDDATLAPPPEPDEAIVDRSGLLESAAELDREWHTGRMSLTQVGTLVGTPHYMAPELWRAQPASRETDVYALGVLLYMLCVGKPPHAAASTMELAARIMERSPVPVREAAASVDPRFAAIVERCLRAERAERFSSGEDLREALEALRDGERRPRSPGGNPYRGLQAFEAEHRDLFFGRGAELRAVLDRLRADAFVLVAGDSGVGKSSLCRASVCPSIAEGAIEPGRRWAYATMTPGRHPLRALVTALAACFDLEQEVVRSAVETRPDSLGWFLHEELGRSQGRLLFVDQLEELVTLGDRREVEVVGKVLAQLAAGIPGVRLLATVRGDFLTRVAGVPALGDELARAIHLLRPLSRAGMREAIVGPAEAMGVRYESPALVDELVDAGIESSLPILQFALAELWEERDPLSRVLTSDDLQGIGGVVGALARHADGLMASLLPMQRVAARALLLRLVTIDDTRASLSHEELVHGDMDSRLALEALVRGRLIVVRDGELGTVYELVHEALIRGWGNLRRWLDAAAEIRELRHRLELATAEWERLGRPRAALWSSAQLDEAAALDRRSVHRREAEFLATSARAVARGRLARRVAAVAIPGALAATYGLVRWQAHVELQARVDARLTEAEQSLASAGTSVDAFLAAQASAFERYDAGADAPARAALAVAEAEALAAERELTAAGRELERALTLDPSRDDVRERLGDALLARAELAAQRRDDDARVAELVERLSLYDPGGERMAEWSAPASLSIETTPPGASLELVEYALDEARRRIPGAPRALGESPISALELAPGSYRLELTVPGRPVVNYPLLVERGESLSLSIEVPPAEAIPPGYVYVPAGRFLMGCSDETLCDVFYNSVPLHQATTGSFLIARHEVTYGDWIELIESSPLERRAELMPRVDQSFVAVALAPVEGGWELAFTRDGDDARARTGQPLAFAGRDRRRSQDWLRMPVLSISFELAGQYLRWLDQSGRLPGARFCEDREWERAGRGADGRLYPHGDHLEPDDANIDVTYGKLTGAAGPDEVGSHPASRSPFGVDDLAGNAGEWTTDPLHGHAPVLRGGAFLMDAVSAHLVGRQVVPPDFTAGTVGLRVCAPFPLPRPVGAAGRGR